MTPDDLVARVKEAALALGFSRVGIATADPAQTMPTYEAWLEQGHHAEMTYMEEHRELKRDSAHLLPGARSVIALALNYNQPVEVRPGYPRIARYALGRDYHKVLRNKLRRLEVQLSEIAPEARHRACVDSAPLLEREYAQRAGIGWPGKNTCLIDSRTGSWFVLGFLITTLELAPDAPAIGGCGTCRICIDACPTGAIVPQGERWVIASDHCISYLTIEHKGPIPDPLHSGIGDWTFGCDVCQEVCPFNQPRESRPERAPATSEPDFLDRRVWPSLVEIAQIDEPTWDRLTQGSPVRRAGYDGLRRNAQINLANQGPSPPSE